MDQRKVLVTGATGFVGSHLCRCLIKNGECNVHLIVRPTSKLTQLEDVKEDVYIHVYDGTIKNMVQILKEVSPDLVYHLASLFISEHQSAHVDDLIRSNILFATQLVEAMVQSDCLKLINTGTSWQHYQNKDYSPVNLYAATKQSFEDILQYYVEVHKLDVITLKLYDTYGPDDSRPKLINLLMRIAETGEELTMSPGEQFIDLVYIDDVVVAFLKAAECMLAGKVRGHERYTVSSGKPIQLRELVELFEKVCGKKLNVKWGERPYRKREVMVPFSPFDSVPGWKPEISLKEGLLRLVK